MNEMGMNEMIGVILILIFSVCGCVIGWIVWVLATNIRQSKTARMQVEIQNKLLEKLGSSPELLTYLQTEAGKHFLESATTERANPLARILGAIQTGVILALLGVAFLLLRVPLSPVGIREVFLTVGTLALALGAGFLISAGISYALSKSWGLLDRYTSGQK